jgi:ATP-dependent DNA helicase RecG
MQRAYNMEQLGFNFTYKSTPLLPLLSADEIFERADQTLLTLLGEDRRIERKPAKTHPQQLGEYFSMWANTLPEGGLVVLGMENKGLFSGCLPLSQNELNEREKADSIFCPDSRTTSKRIRVLNKNGHEDYVVLFRTLYREDKVVKDVSGNAFIRKGDEKHKLSNDEIRELQIDKGQIDFEREPTTLTFPDDFREDIIETFIEGIHRIRNLEHSHSREEILQQRRLGKIIKGVFVPNNACVLLFAKDPNILFPGCSIRFLRYEGETEETGHKYNVIKDIWFEGCVPELIIDSTREIQSQLREFSRLDKDGKFYTAPEYPDEAWYEAIVNACVHRSYSLRSMNIFVRMFDDRLVVESPGGFPPLVNPETIYNAHIPRNPFLMNAMFYLDFVKCANEGTKRMRDTMEAMKLPHPEFQQTQEAIGALSVRVTLKNNRKQRKVWIDSNVLEYIPHEIAATLTTEEMRIVNFIGENGQVKVVEAHRLLQPTIKTWQTVKKILLRLCDRGILVHVHSKTIERDANAYFKFAEPPKQTNDLRAKNGK